MNEYTAYGTTEYSASGDEQLRLRLEALTADRDKLARENARLAQSLEDMQRQLDAMSADAAARLLSAPQAAPRTEPRVMYTRVEPARQRERQTPRASAESFAAAEAVTKTALAIPRRLVPHEGETDRERADRLQSWLDAMLALITALSLGERAAGSVDEPANTQTSPQSVPSPPNESAAAAAPAITPPIPTAVPQSAPVMPAAAARTVPPVIPQSIAPTPQLVPPPVSPAMTFGQQRPIAAPAPRPIQQPALVSPPVSPQPVIAPPQTQSAPRPEPERPTALPRKTPKRRGLGGLFWLLITPLFLIIAFGTALIVYRVTHPQDETLYGYKPLIVTTDSMDGEDTHAIKPGALVIAVQTPFDSLELGDIITFERSDGLLNTHRIISISDGAIITKGDNAAEPDAGYVTPFTFRYKVVLIMNWTAGFGKKPIETVKVLAAPLGIIALIVLAYLSATKPRREDAGDELDWDRIERMAQERASAYSAMYSPREAVSPVETAAALRMTAAPLQQQGAYTRHANPYYGGAQQMGQQQYRP
ncbi:MAG: hypothetical protein LBC78_01575 [Oscillospiraceae bacterium]|jgi:hypothetical protein|nr:hypothetical protein [Oscillospiraceae bacterium]